MVPQPEDFHEARDATTINLGPIHGPVLDSSITTKAYGHPFALDLGKAVPAEKGVEKKVFRGNNRFA